MPFLTFLNYAALENTSKGIVSQFEQKDKEISYLREKEINNADAIADLKRQFHEFMSSVRTLDDPSRQKIAENMISKGIYVNKASDMS
jgi:hypothetical protein